MSRSRSWAGQRRHNVGNRVVGGGFILEARGRRKGATGRSRVKRRCGGKRKLKMVQAGRQGGVVIAATKRSRQAGIAQRVSPIYQMQRPWTGLERLTRERRPFPVPICRATTRVASLATQYRPPMGSNPGRSDLPPRCRHNNGVAAQIQGKLACRRTPPFLSP